MIVVLNQILVLSPDGPCFVYRNYSNDKQEIDPQLISAMVALKSSGSISLSTISNILESEVGNKHRYAMEISKTHNYITCALSSNHSNSQKLRHVLPKINQLIYETIGNPYRVRSIEKNNIRKMENNIDLIMIKEGLIGG